jgi:hypothetical protein
LTEHLLALVKPTALKAFSTLNPLVTTSNNHADEDFIVEAVPCKKPETFLSRAARMLQGDHPGEDDEDEADSRSVCTLKGAENTLSPSRSETGEILMSAAATLDEGALPVREFPSNLTSEPASMAQSTNSSVSEEKMDNSQRPSANSVRGSHQEELRCVVAIIRHGDRTPKQKLKFNMSEPHILKYFHDQ